MATRRRRRLDVLAAMLYATKRGMSWSNCYAYARDMVTPSSTGSYKLQPGHLSGDDSPIDLHDCSDLRARLAHDGVRERLASSSSCPRNTHEIAAYLARGKDYHFYRKDEDVIVHYRGTATTTTTMAAAASLAKKFGVPVSHVKMFPEQHLALIEGANMWTHKPGTTSARSADSCDRPIRDPDDACRGSGDLLYHIPCGRFCARNPTRAEAVTIVPADPDAADADLARRLSTNAHVMSKNALR